MTRDELIDILYVHGGHFDCSIEHVADEIMETIGDNSVDNSNDKIKIRSEIDNLLDISIGWDDDYYCGYSMALESVLEFIDNLK